MIRYALAAPADDAPLRALLREPMEGWARMAMTREPSFFAAEVHGAVWGKEWAVLAKEGETPIGMYLGAEHPAHVNGELAAVGYLGGLRIAPACRRRFSVVRGGYASIRALCPFQPLPTLWYTAIAAENRSARRLLEAGLPGLPRYAFRNEFARARRHALWQAVETASQRAAFCDFYNRAASAWQFSPALTPDALASIAACPFAVWVNGGIAATMALWNQQAARQVRACGYRFPLGYLRPLYNFWASLSGRICLPPPGAALDQSFLAFFTVADPDDSVRMSTLIEDALALCETRVLSFGMHAEHPWLTPLRHLFSPAQYRSRLYAVTFGEPLELDGRLAQPDAAAL